MAVKSPGFVQVTTATTGNGPYTLTNTVPSGTDYRSIANAVSDGSLANGDTVHYVIFQTGVPTGKMFERGWGTINTTTLVLTPTTGVEKSAALVSGGGWGAGTKDVYFAPPGAESVALLEYANTFNQILTMNDKSIDIAVGGVIRGRLIYQGNVLYLQYYSNLFALQGALQIGNNTLQFNNGTTTKDVALVDPAASYDKFPSGTAMVFRQAAAPTGWTKSTADNDAALRVVSGTPGASGGSLGLSSSVTGSHILTANELASHTHPLGSGGSGVYGEPTSGVAGRFISTSTSRHSLFTATESAGSDVGHTHPLALKYVDCLVATKN